MTGKAGGWTLTPYLTVKNGHDAVTFYERAFGAKPVMVLNAPDGSKIVHAELDLNGTRLYLSDACDADAPAGVSGITLHLEVPDSDATAARAVEAGATLVMPVTEMFWGARYGQVKDPFGIAWALSTQVREPSAEDIEAGIRQMYTEKKA